MIVRILAFAFLLMPTLNAWATFSEKSFAQLPDVADVELSPNGDMIATMNRVDIETQKGISVNVTNLKSGSSELVLFSPSEDFVIYNIAWKDNDTLMAFGFKPTELEFRGIAQMYDVEARIARMLFVNVKTKKVTHPFNQNFLRKFRAPPADLATVVDPFRDDPEQVLMYVYGVAYRVNIHNGVAKLYDKDIPNKFYPNVFDRQQRLRAGYYWLNGVTTVKFYDLEQQEWRDIGSYEGAFSKDEIDILGFGENPNELYVRQYLNDRKAIFKVDLTSEDLTRELVFAHDQYDADGHLIYSWSKKRVIGIAGSDSSQTKFFDDDLEKLRLSLDKAMPDVDIQYYSFSDELDKFLIYTTGPTESGTFYLVNTSPLSVEALAYRYKDLPPQVLNPVEEVTYKARDGLSIEAYLTLPKGKEPKNLPTVILPHGGPIARDTARFDYWAQFLATKGYAVLQMNFRGSSGYGYEHMKSGLGQWGGDMQNDIEDGVAYLLDRGVANKDRLAIVGASYGGYAALMGVIKTPDLFNCAVSVAGVSDVRKLALDHRQGYQVYNSVDEQIGTGGKYLNSISPVNMADAVKVPVLLIHGNLDRQVDIEHSEKMYAALKDADKDVEFIVLEGEDHFLSIEENRIKTFKALGSFVDQCNQ